MDRATLAGPTRNSQPAAAPEEHIPTAVSQAMARASDAALSIATRVEAVADVLKYGFLRDAGAFLAPFADAPEAVELGGFCERLLAGEALLADLSLGAGLERRKCVSIMVALAPGARRTVMVFSGIAAVPFPLNFGFFHPPRDCNFVFLSDPTRRFLLTRTPGLGDTYEATLASVGRVLAGLDTAAVFAMGLSSGGYPALRLGLDLGARGVLNFSGPTTIDMDDDPGAPMSKYPQLVGIYRSAPHLVIGMHKLYARAATRPSVILIHGDAHPRDTWMAHLLADNLGAGSSVELRPMPGFAEHDTFSAYIEAGRIEGAFVELLGLQEHQARPGLCPDPAEGSPLETWDPRATGPWRVWAAPSS